MFTGTEIGKTSLIRPTDANHIVNTLCDNETEKIHSNNRMILLTSKLCKLDESYTAKPVRRP